MPVLDFKGRQFVYLRQYAKIFFELNVNEKKSLPVINTKANLDDNLIICGDNLHLLKSLMPSYAEKVKSKKI